MILLALSALTRQPGIIVHIPELFIKSVQVVGKTIRTSHVEVPIYRYFFFNVLTNEEKKSKEAAQIK